MSKKIAIIFLSACSFLFQGSAFGAGSSCFTNVRIAYVDIGFVDGSIAEADSGNGIYFGYYNGDGTTTSQIKVNPYMNLNDGNKGIAMYHSLITALTLGARVDGWDHDNTVGGYGTCNDIDEIRLRH